MLVNTPFGSISFVPGCGWVNGANQSDQVRKGKKRKTDKDDKSQPVEKG